MFRNFAANFSHPQNSNFNHSQIQQSCWNTSQYPILCQEAQIFKQDNLKYDKTELILESRKHDQAFLESFINERNETEKQVGNKISCKISETKTALITVHFLNERLTKIIEKLQNKSLSELEWQRECKTCEEIKEQIENIMSNLKKKDFLNVVKRSLHDRKKKRLRDKRKREEWKIKKIQLEERRSRLHNKADNWIKERQNIIEKEKQEENLRKDADVVLFDVRGKRNDAKKFLALLRELENLRKIKVTIAKARGEHLSSAAEESFNNIVVKLMEQWKALDREYSLEEQGLKLMIKTDNDLKIEKQKKTVFDDWEIVLFGKPIQNNYFLQGNMRNFIHVRTAWDKYININDGSPIPIGWVVPNTPSSAAWQKCLKKE